LQKRQAGFLYLRAAIAHSLHMQTPSFWQIMHSSGAINSIIFSSISCN